MSTLTNQASATTRQAQGIIIHPRTAAESGDPDYSGVCAEVVTVSASQSLFDGLSWESSAVSAALGLPLKVARWQADRDQPNEGVLGLFMRIDPEQENFGKVKYRFIDGAVLVARADGEGKAELGPRKVEAMMCYLCDVSHEIKVFLNEEHEDRVSEARDLAGRILTEEAFGRFFATYQAKKADAKKLQMERVESDFLDDGGWGGIAAEKRD